MLVRKAVTNSGVTRSLVTALRTPSICRQKARRPDKERKVVVS